MGDDESILLPEQCRAARAGLGLGVEELASTAGLAPSTVTGFETGRTRGSAETRAALKRALEHAGAEFDQDREVGFKVERKSVRGRRRRRAE